MPSEKLNGSVLPPILATHDKPIEAGLQAMLLTMPKMPHQAVAILRFMFFAGANHYRTLNRVTFEMGDADTLCRMLANVAAEIDKWEHEEVPIAVRQT